MNTLLAAHQLSRDYGEFRAVDALNFTLERGQVLGFLGPNGAGKSTTLQMLAGVLAPSEGRVEVLGGDLREYPRRMKANIGYLPEHPPLYSEMRVAEYLRFCARLRGVPTQHVGNALDLALSQCNLTDVAQRLIGNLSKGFQQRVGIAQAIIHNPPIMLFDEPTVGLDPNQMQEIRELIRQLSQDRGVILSTHLLPEVQEICTHVQIIHQGKLVLKDTLTGLQQHTQNQVLKLKFKRPPAADALSALPQVRQVKISEDGYIRLHHTNAEAVAESIVAQAVAQHWGLLEMTPESHSLEAIFTELTRTSDAHHRPA